MNSHADPATASFKLELGGYQGASGYRLANSLEAVVHAIELGADWCHLQVCALADNTLVLSQSPQLDGIKLRSLDWAQAHHRWPAMARLDQALAVAKDLIKLNLELMGSGFEKPLAEAFMACQLPDRIATSTQEEVLGRVSAFAPALKTGLVMGGETMRSLRRGDVWGRLRMERLGISTAVVEMDLLRQSIWREQLRGCEVWAWGLEGPEDLPLLTELGVKVAFSPRPDLPPQEHEQYDDLLPTSRPRAGSRSRYNYSQQLPF